MKHIFSNRVLHILVVLCLGACATPVEVLDPIPLNVKKEINITSVHVSYGAVGHDTITKLDQKREAERLDDEIEIVRASNGRVHIDHYEYLPLKDMLQYTVENVLRDSGLMGSVNVSLAIHIDTLRFANAGLTILAGDTDQLAGLVSILDEDQNTLGQFYVDVIEAHGGLLGLAIRGGGVREGLAYKFSEELVKELKNLEP